MSVAGGGYPPPGHTHHHYLRPLHQFIFTTGPGGIGKTTATKQIALSWADGSADELKQFDFVFHVTLKHVKDNQNIEDIIIKQHPGLSGNRVKSSEIKSILVGETNQRVFILLDGYDEYNPGTNTHIDSAITKQYLRTCWILITSRESKELLKVCDYFDTEVEILGFDHQGVEDYISKYLGSRERCVVFLKDKMKTHFTSHFDYGIFHIPILLHMVCVLHIGNVSIPRTKTGILSAIVERCLNWEAIRKTGTKTAQKVHGILVKLCQFVLNELRKGKQVFLKVARYFKVI